MPSGPECRDHFRRGERRESCLEHDPLRGSTSLPSPSLPPKPDPHPEPTWQETPVLAAQLEPRLLLEHPVCITSPVGVARTTHRLVTFVLSSFVNSLAFLLRVGLR